MPCIASKPGHQIASDRNQLFKPCLVDPKRVTLVQLPYSSVIGTAEKHQQKAVHEGKKLKRTKQ